MQHRRCRWYRAAPLPTLQDESRLGILGGGGLVCATCSPRLRRLSRGQIPELLQVLFLLLVPWRQIKQSRRGAAEDVVLGLLGEERQVVDGRGQIEVPVRVVRRIQKLRLGV